MLFYVFSRSRVVFFVFCFCFSFFVFCFSFFLFFVVLFLRFLFLCCFAFMVLTMILRFICSCVILRVAFASDLLPHVTFFVFFCTGNWLSSSDSGCFLSGPTLQDVDCPPTFS